MWKKYADSVLNLEREREREREKGREREREKGTERERERERKKERKGERKRSLTRLLLTRLGIQNRPRSQKDLNLAAPRCFDSIFAGTAFWESSIFVNTPLPTFRTRRQKE